MNEQPSNTPKTVTEQLEQTIPLADDKFQQDLENQLMAEWYQVAGKSKRKNPLRGKVPFTYVASLIAILLTITIVIFQSLGTKPADESSRVNLPVATQVPTPKLATSTPDMFTNPGEIALQLAPNTVAMAMEIDETGDHLLVGDVIGIRAVINRDQVIGIPEPIQSEVIALLDQYKMDELSVLLIKNAVIIKIEENVLSLQVSQQESIVLAWLINSEIPYEIEQMTMPDSSETPIGIAPNRVIYTVEINYENYIPLVAGDKLNITATFSRDEFPNLQAKLANVIGTISEDTTNNTVTIQIVTDAIVIRAQKKIGIIALQMTRDEASTLQWLTEMQIPYKIKKVG